MLKFAAEADRKEISHESWERSPFTASPARPSQRITRRFSRRGAVAEGISRAKD